MKLFSINGNSQSLDGGAMFGNAPKAMWSRWVSVDDQNRILLSCRALLIQEAGRNILLEAGVGAFFDPKLKERYGVVEEEHVLLTSLQKVGLTHEDIDIVVLSHLHFDHAGGILSAWMPNTEATLLFPNATFIMSEAAWERAQHPHARDRASFIPHLNKLLAESGRIHLVSGESDPLLGKNYRFHYSEGHTPGLLLTEVAHPQGPIVFAGDLIPGTPWVHLPITMGYDRAPEFVINEKEILLNDLVARHGYLFYTHDTKTALSGVSCDEKGKFHAVDLHSEIVGDFC